MRRSAIVTILIAVAFWVGGSFTRADPNARFRLAPTAADKVSARLLFMPEDAPKRFEQPPAGRRRLVFTGAYSSGDRFAPEGMVIRNGRATNPRPQGWDGVLLVDAAGRVSLHNKRRVSHRGRVFDLTDREERVAFLGRAARDKLSLVQSHLLISDGALDVREVAGARRFRRRLLFQTRSGQIGVYESRPRAVTLYEAAEELMALAQPEMALNLDMGAYDFCEAREGDEIANCGVLPRDRLDKLTNFLELTIAP